MPGSYRQRVPAAHIPRWVLRSDAPYLPVDMRHHPPSTLNARSGSSRHSAWWRSLALVAASLSMVACSSVSSTASSVGSWVTPYKIDIIQGNVVTREQAQALQPGMPRDQVKGILGSPLLASVFHGNRWDYVFTFKRQGQDSQQRRVTVFFKDDVLEKVEADELPSETEFVSSLDAKHATDKVPPLEATEEQLKKFEAGNANAANGAAADAPVAPIKNYPPLETPGGSR